MTINLVERLMCIACHPVWIIRCTIKNTTLSNLDMFSGGGEKGHNFDFWLGNFQ